jgi:hypothetical protein
MYNIYRFSDTILNIDFKLKSITNSQCIYKMRIFFNSFDLWSSNVNITFNSLRRLMEIKFFQVKDEIIFSEKNIILI